MPTYAEYLAGLNASLVLALDSTNGLTDLSGNGRDGTGAGGVVVGGDSPGPFDAGATDFDGTDDRITTTYSTRRNVWVNPSFETNITGVTNAACTTAQSSTQAYDGTYSCKVTSTGASAAPNATGAALAAAVAGTQYTFSFYAFHTVAGRTGRADLRFYDSGGTIIGSLTAGSNTALTQNAWTRLSVTATAPALTAYVGWVARMDVLAAGAASEISYIDAILIEAASSAGTYFPTSAQLASGEAGWLGTAHASASDIGCFANGTTRTFMGWAYRDASAATHSLISGDASFASNAFPQILLLTGSNTFRFRPLNSGTVVSWTDAWPGNAQWVHWALVFNEATDSASLYINGTLVSTQTTSLQYAAGAGNAIIGRSSVSAVDPFDGKQAWVSVHERALTPDEILDAAEFSDPTRSGSPLPRTEVRPMSLKADELLADLPPYEADSVWVQDVMDAVGREVERLDEFTEFIREGLRPQNATDQYRLLGMWETLMGLPVEPSGVSLIARQNRVTAAARRRKAGEGEGWVIAISLAIDTYAWTHSENDPGDYQLTVEMPFPSDAFNAGVLEAMLRAVTPAALQITVVYTDSFRVGISLVGDSL